MQYGICHLSIIPVRSAADHLGEMVTQLLYGDPYKVLEQRKAWSRIRLHFDGYEGWIANTQLYCISEEAYGQMEPGVASKVVSDLVDFVETEKGILIPIVLGSSVAHTALMHHSFHGNVVGRTNKKNGLLKTAMLYLNAPYLWGGKTPFGLDCSGFTQMVYKINGYRLLRNAAAQATQGEALSFVEESEPGDVAFFDNAEGKIDHVGLLMQDNHIIHVHGKVRIDRIDHTGIFNTETGKYTHQLRVIKKMI